MGLSDVWVFVSQYGPVYGILVVALIFFMWKDWRRETHLMEHAEALEHDLKEMTVPLLEKCTVVIAQNTILLSQVSQEISKCSFARQHKEQCVLDKASE